MGGKKVELAIQVLEDQGMDVGAEPIELACRGVGDADGA